jgi:hypothetical protein
MTTIDQTPLGAIARTAREARAALEQIEGRLGEFREKAQGLDEFRAKNDSARERRAQLLEAAMLAGRPADTTAIDKECTRAALALEKRQDEILAVSRAVRALEAQRETAQSELNTAMAVYQEARKEQAAAIAHAGYLATRFHAALAVASESLAQMPSPYFRERLLAARSALLDSDPLPSAADIHELVTAEAEAGLTKADELAAIPLAPAPRCLGFVWADGELHDEPEPASEHVPTYKPVINVGLTS